MNTEELKELQAPLKAKYRETPEAAVITLKADGTLGDGITCRVQTGKALTAAGLHPATGGNGLSACSGDMLLESLVACAGVTLGAVATALDIPLRDATVCAEGDLDFRGTLGLSKEVPVGFQNIRLRFDLDTDATEEQIATLCKMAELFMGAAETNNTGAVVLPGGTANDRDPGIRTILFTDIVESTVMTQQLGDEAAMELVSVHDQVVRDALNELGGREIKHLGDGIMASFVSAAGAVKCATRVQNEIAKHARANADRTIRIRVGIAAGEPVERHNDLFGVTVQLAAHLCSHAQAEQILVSNVVAELCEGKTLPFEDFGEVALKGFEQPVRSHAVSWASEAASA